MSGTCIHIFHEIQKPCHDKTDCAAKLLLSTSNVIKLTNLLAQRCVCVTRLFPISDRVLWNIGRIHPKSLLTSRFDRPPIAKYHIAHIKTTLRDDMNITVGLAVEEGRTCAQAMCVIASDPFECVLVSDPVNHLSQVTRMRREQNAHKRPKRSVSSSKNPSASKSPINIALGSRSDTRHQSATVIPKVRSDFVSTSTFTCRPVNSFGLIK